MIIYGLKQYIIEKANNMGNLLAIPHPWSWDKDIFGKTPKALCKKKLEFKKYGLYVYNIKKCVILNVYTRLELKHDINIWHGKNNPDVF